MNVFILAAGLGTRLRPWTLYHPKALAEVDGHPILDHVIKNVIHHGATDIVVNVHHFSDQIISFLKGKDYGIPIKISDENHALLDTGGGLLKALDLFDNAQPVLVHNVDILSNISLANLYNTHIDSNTDITLAVSQRQSTRQLIFSKEGALRGWHNETTNEYKPLDFIPQNDYLKRAFSGIYVVGAKAQDSLRRYSTPEKPFPIMDFLLSHTNTLNIKEYFAHNMQVLDIGKPQSLKDASEFISHYCQ